MHDSGDSGKGLHAAFAPLTHSDSRTPLLSCLADCPRVGETPVRDEGLALADNALTVSNVATLKWSMNAKGPANKQQ